MATACRLPARPRPLVASAASSGAGLNSAVACSTTGVWNVMIREIVD